MFVIYCHFGLDEKERGTTLNPMLFYLLAKVARFEFRGQQFQKTAMSMAQDEHRNGTPFRPETEVTPIGKPLLLPDAEAEKWKPVVDWTELMIVNRRF
jgi:hypothetical protein